FSRDWSSDVCSSDLSCFAKVRSTRPPTAARLLVEDGTAAVELLDGEAGVAPGQACVLYSAPGDDARVYGGGFIARSERSEEAEGSEERRVGKPERVR